MELFWSVCFVLLLLHQATVTITAVSDEESIDRPVKYTASNFHAMLVTTDPWIIAYVEKFDGEEERDLVALARSLSGAVRVGFVDIDDRASKELLQARGVSCPEVHVYEHGIKNQPPIKAPTLKKAVEIAEDSVPDRFTAISEGILVPYYKQQMEQSVPTKMPVIWLTNKKHLPGFLRSASLFFGDLFSFAKFVNPTEETMAAFHITTFPQLLTLNHLDLKTGEFQVLAYEVAHYGDLNTTNVIHYLVSVISQLGDTTHKAMLQKLMKAEQTDENRIQELDRKSVLPVNMLNLRIACAESMVGICVFVFLDCKDKNDIEYWKATLNRIRKSDILKFHHIRYLYVNATCHTNFAKHFGVKPKRLPELVAVKRDSNEFALMKGSHSFDRIRKFILGVLDTTTELTAIGEFPSVDDDCREIGKASPCKGKKCSGKRKTSGGPSISRNKQEL